MPSALADTKRRMLDEALRPWRTAASNRPPRGGWLKTIRTALGMTTQQAGTRLGVSQSRMFRIEQAEADGSLSLKNLRDAANALDCDLVYAVVPRRPISEVLSERAQAKAKTFVDRVLHSMALEAQSPAEASAQEMIDERARSLLAGPLRRLWDDETS
jgi:predicted DNA-binding mobile mystery protein A